MPRLIPIFDTNVYRKVRPEEIQRVRVLERSHGLAGMCSAHVLVELLSHLADPSDRHYSTCRRAIRSAWLHCSSFFYGEYLPVILSPRNTVIHSLIGRDSQDEVDLREQVSSLAREIALRPDADDLSDLRGALQAFRDQMLARERDYAESLEALLKTVFEGEATPRQRLHIIRDRGVEWSAGKLVDEFLASSGVPDTAVDLPAFRDRVHRDFPVAVHLYHLQIEKLVGGNGEMRVDPNNLWDREITLFLSPVLRAANRALFNEAPAVLVTDEGEIKTAAVRAGFASYVVGWSEYVDFLENGDLTRLPML